MKKITIDNITNLINNNTNYLHGVDFEQFLILDKDWDTEQFKNNVVGIIYEYTVIYYANAMKILMDNDASLCASLELASDNGYQITDLNSETLATLLVQQIMIEELHELDFEQYVDPSDHR